MNKAFPRAAFSCAITNTAHMYIYIYTLFLFFFGGGAYHGVAAPNPLVISQYSKAVARFFGIWRTPIQRYLAVLTLRGILELYGGYCVEGEMDFVAFHIVQRSKNNMAAYSTVYGTTGVLCRPVLWTTGIGR